MQAIFVRTIKSKDIMKKLILLLSLILISSSLIFGQDKVDDPKFEKMLSGLLDHSVPEVTVAQIKDSSQIIFLDAREINEFNISHIDSAIWVGYNTFQIDSLKDISKQSKIVVYCSVGYRSEKVSEKLIKAGYTDVSNLYGGIFEWSNSKLPLFDRKGITDTVHAYDQNWGKWVSTESKVYNE